jgi:hypothetical protein
MRRRIAIMIAVSALVIGGAAPALAGRPDNPGGDRGVSADHIGLRGGEVGDDIQGPPEWAKAYGKRILDAYGLPYGHLLQCADGAEAFAACEDALAVGEGGTVFPEDPGAMVFWTTNGHLFI